MLRYIFSFFIVMATLAATAQKNTDEELAAQYYANGEYEKAIVLYEKLLDKTPNSPYYYDNLFTSYLKIKDYDKCEKMVKKQVKRFSSNYYFKVDLGYVYDEKGEKKDAEKQYESCIKAMEASQDEVVALSNAFIKRGLTSYAITTILKARSLFKNDVIMALELGELYLKTGDKQKMINEYLNYAEAFEDIEQVKNKLSDNMRSEDDWKLLKKEILTRIQKKPEQQEYSELLLWVLVQQKDFYAAFIQFKALDKRLNENGRRLIELAQIALTNEAFDVAEDCYKYVINLGKDDKPYYVDAHLGLLSVSYIKITDLGEYTPEYLVATEKAYLDFLRQMGESYYTSPSMRQLAYLYNYYMDKPNEAIALLKKLVEMPRVSRSFQAECKLELGDAYLVGGDIWEAQLLYGQVDKDFKEEPLGQEAKFRNARLSFYKGEFEWAQAQLEILKSATSQLISNNAIELSLLIQDNSGYDETDSALLLYSQADLLLFQNKPDAALLKLDSIKILFPTHPLNDEILLVKARIYRKKKMYDKAVEYYDAVVKDFGFDILADNALFEMAEVYERQLNNKDKAKELYEKLLTDYPGSLFTVEARKRFRRLRGDKVEQTPQQQDYEYLGP